MQEILDDGEPPLLVLSALHRALRTARAARALAAQRTPREEIASRLRLPPWKMDELISPAAAGRRTTCAPPCRRWTRPIAS